MKKPELFIRQSVASDNRLGADHHQGFVHTVTHVHLFLHFVFYFATVKLSEKIFAFRCEVLCFL
ncbi:hypothetical protein [Acetobacterium tundrae]|uniref:Uncharacterized protein n=1 Tax=Acetobacterium tundrae TaxID=132932 RepID=A0ABR6WN32_9FIRM|nr:hypothetical protein [Acetobacterium tundrae]MBC3797560.1 hypothetical protein [Acetobacterium tundrae]